MKTDIVVERLDAKELPTYEVTFQITQCENRFEILMKPGQQVSSWDTWLLQGHLAKWLQSRMDSQKSGGHNPPNSP